MREIKFRGLRTDGKGWVYGSLVNNLWTHSEHSEYHRQPVCEIITNGECNDYEEMEYNEQNVSVIPESVGQYTGLKDKNDKEIYEGDILSHNDYSKGACLTFEQFKRISNVVIDNLFDGIRLYGMGGTYTKKDKESMGIIGNIHETP